MRGARAVPIDPSGKRIATEPFRISSRSHLDIELERTPT